VTTGAGPNLKKRRAMVDPEKMLSDIVSSGFDLSRFRQVDETDIPQPKNFLEWIVNREFCNTTVLPWQVEAGMKLFSDYCPVCTNPDYKDDLFDETIQEIRDNVCFLEDGVCPKCAKNRMELFSYDSPKLSFKNEFVAACGQRAGKSKSIALYTSYQLNRWLSLPDPLGYYGLPTLEIVVGTFSAMSADQAEINLWIPFKGLYDNAPWFTKYNDFLRAEEKRLSVPLVFVKDTYISYPHKRFITNFTGAEDRKKRGATRLWGVVDEIAHFNSTKTGSRKKIMDADGNYAALNNSLATLRQKSLIVMKKGDYNAQTAVMYNASSPLNAMDKIMRLVKGSGPQAVVVHKATWELNPDYTHESARAQNSGLSQIEFDRDFGAIPPFSDAPYIGEARVMEKLCGLQKQKPMEAFPAVFTDQMGDKYLYLEAKFPKLDRLMPRMLTLDNGYKQNAFAATLFSYDMMERKPVLDFAISLYPQPDQGLNVNFPMMFKHFIEPIVKNLRIVQVFYDRWQSLDQIQRLRDMRIDAQAHSLSYEKDFLPFRQQLMSGNMILPPCEVPIRDVKESSNPLSITAANPITNLIWQTLTVREAGRKIIKPEEGDDDIFRAFVLGGSRFLHEEIARKYHSMGGVGDALGGLSVGTYTSLKNNGSVQNPSPGAVQRVSQFATIRTHRRR